MVQQVMNFRQLGLTAKRCPRRRFFEQGGELRRQLAKFWKFAPQLLAGGSAGVFQATASRIVVTVSGLWFCVTESTMAQVVGPKEQAGGC